MASQVLLGVTARLFVSSRIKPKRRKTRTSSLGAVSTDNFQDPYNTRLCKPLVLAQLVTFVLFATSLVLHELDLFSNHLDWLDKYQWLLVVSSSMCFLVVESCATPYLNEQFAELICGLVSEANSSACFAALSTAGFNMYMFVFIRLRQSIETFKEEQLNNQNSIPVATLTPDDYEPQLEDFISTTPATTTMTAVRRTLYFRPVLFVCSMALIATLTYVIKFDSSSSKKRERIRTAMLERTSSQVGVAKTMPSSPQPPSYSESVEIQIEMTKL
jgi:hypothetical protein